MQLPIEAMVERIETGDEFTWLDPLGERIQELAKKLIPDGSMQKHLLSGAWWGHPVHPMLTDVAIGAYTSAWVLDLLPSDRARRAADTLIGVGVLSALPTAAAGLSDWSDLDRGPRRIGSVHAATNLAALLLYSLSLVARKGDRRKLGWTLAQLGAGAATAAGFLGGHLVYRRGIGVNRTAFERQLPRWTPAIELGDLPQGKPTKATVKGADVVLYRREADVWALSDRCTHLGCSLAAGTVNDGVITCRCHGSAFRLAGGEIVRGPATAPAPAYETRVREGQVEIRVASGGRKQVSTDR